jgi:uncharacterized protein (DUF58 family)
MLTREVLRQVRRLQLRARRAVEDPLGGAYRSVFKGSGIAFEEVREYQPGDDIRAIDWNVTARMGHPFIKRYVEERELTVILAIDASASLAFGTTDQSKREVVSEIGALLTLCAAGNNDKAGLVLFTDRVEKFVPPRKGARHALRIIRDLFVVRPEYPGTDLGAALDFINRVTRRRVLLFLFSDFLTTGYERALERTGHRHDVVAVVVSDPREQELPAVGLVEMQDAETGERLIVDTSSPRFRTAFKERQTERRAAFAQLARSHRIDVLDVSTAGGHLDALIRFFRIRERRLRRT